jgi:hypothetical protein
MLITLLLGVQPQVSLCEEEATWKREGQAEAVIS